MRVAAFAELTGPDGVEIRERPDPEPGADEAVIRVEACSINHHDLWILNGDSAMVAGEDLPFVSGLDVAGVVEAVGSAVRTASGSDESTELAEGDRVVLCPNETCGVCRYCRAGPEMLCEAFGLYHGGLAERAVVAADRLVRLPDAVDFATAAALPTAYVTAFRMLKRAEVEPSDRVFVPGATGGVGIAAVQLAGRMGATTVGTSRSAAKLDRLRETADLDETVASGDIDEIREAVGKRGTVDAVVNHLGGEFTELGLDLLRRGGRMVVCGRTAGDRSAFDVADLFLNHHRIVGSTMGTQTDLERLVSLVDDGDLDPVVAETFPLEETAEAFRTMDEGDVFGKLVVEP